MTLLCCLFCTSLQGKFSAPIFGGRILGSSWSSSTPPGPLFPHPGPFMRYPILNILFSLVIAMDSLLSPSPCKPMSRGLCRLWINLLSVYLTPVCWADPVATLNLLDSQSHPYRLTIRNSPKPLPRQYSVPFSLQTWTLANPSSPPPAHNKHTQNLAQQRLLSSEVTLASTAPETPLTEPGLPSATLHTNTTGVATPSRPPQPLPGGSCKKHLLTQVKVPRPATFSPRPAHHRRTRSQGPRGPWICVSAA